MLNETFNKQIYTAPLLLSDLGYLIFRMPSIISAILGKNINRGFIEKIMTVTSAVNGCSYCTWFHASQALSSGISDSEVKNMLNLQFQTDADDREVAALLFAQHYAETNRNPTREMTQRLLNTYGEKTAGQINLFIRLITFGNLIGNTWDAVLSRFSGKPKENSSILFEIIFIAFTFWFMFPIMLISKNNKQISHL